MLLVVTSNDGSKWLVIFNIIAFSWFQPEMSRQLTEDILKKEVNTWFYLDFLHWLQIFPYANIKFFTLNCISYTIFKSCIFRWKQIKHLYFREKRVALWFVIQAKRECTHCQFCECCPFGYIWSNSVLC